MSAEADGVRPEPDVVRACLPILAVGVVILAAVADPGSWWEIVLLVVAAGVILAWSRWPIPLAVVAFGVLVPTVLAQSNGALEPGMFLISVLGLVLTGWQRLTPQTAVLTAAAVASPIVVQLIQDDIDKVSWPVWVVGIVFPAFMGWAFHRQEILAADLEQARRDLAQQAVLEERQRIARDVHDLVGHGLAAMMLQVTSARHVLDRDPAAAGEALDAAEGVGRQSLQDLRRTVAMLREADSAIASPPQSLGQVSRLVESVRTSGLRVEYVEHGSPADVDPAAGLTLYRIAQESLANASRHAPRASTVVTTTVTEHDARLEVRTSGPLVPATRADEGRARYGLRGMRERSDAAGGEFWAGPVRGGWLVRCSLPLDDDRRGRRTPTTNEDTEEVAT